MFTYSFAVQATFKAYQQNITNKQKAKEFINHCIKETLQSNTHQYFGKVWKRTFDYIPTQESSILYLGHLNLMLYYFLQITEDAVFKEIQKNINNYLLKAYINSPSLILPSYNNQYWIADNAVAIASLKLSLPHDKNVNELTTKWKEKTQKDYIDKNQLIYTQINKEGDNTEEARESSISWFCMYTSLFDKEWSKRIYIKYKEVYGRKKLLFFFFKEREKVKRKEIKIQDH